MNEKQKLENDKIDGFFSSPTGFWISVVTAGAILLGVIGTTIASWFQ